MHESLDMVRSFRYGGGDGKDGMMRLAARYLGFVRHKWCRLRGHPMVVFTVFSQRDPDRLLPDGTIEEGAEYQMKAEVCALHGKDGLH